MGEIFLLFFFVRNLLQSHAATKRTTPHFSFVFLFDRSRSLLYHRKKQMEYVAGVASTVAGAAAAHPGIALGVAGVAAVAAAPVALGVIGFSAVGPVAGTLAAKAMAAGWAGTAIYGAAQSVAMAGTAVVTKVAVGAVGAAIGTALGGL